MDLKLLATFLEVSNTLNFTKSAARLGYVQSSITAQIKQLEDELGVRLFERIGKTVALTYSGKKLVPYAVQILEMAKNMKAAISVSPEPSGTLTIGAAESLTIYRLPELFRQYRVLYPKVDLNLKLLGCTEFLPSLLNGTIDIAFAVGIRNEASYIKEAVLLPEPVAVLASPTHPLTQKEAILPEDFENQALILTGDGCTYRSSFLGLLNRYNISPRIALETDSIQAIKQAAISGLGICVLPRVAVKDELSSGSLSTLNMDTESFKIVSQLFYHKDKWLSPALTAFINLSREILKGTPESPETQVDMLYTRKI